MKGRKSKENTSNSNLPRKKLPNIVNNGKLNIKVEGYSGIQKIPISALIQYIPISKLKEATVKVLVASGTRRSRRTSNLK